MKEKIKANKKRYMISALLGVLAFFVSIFPFAVDTTYDAYISFGTVICLFCSMVMGKDCGLICGIIGSLYPFYIYNEYGWANFCIMLFLVIWIYFAGLVSELIRKRKAAFFMLYIFQAVFIVLCILTAPPLMRFAVSCNPPFWTDSYTLIYLPDNIINSSITLLLEMLTIMLLFISSVLTFPVFDKYIFGTRPHSGTTFPIMFFALAAAFISSSVSGSAEGVMMSIDFSVNSYKSSVGTMQLSLLKTAAIMFAADFAIHLSDYRYMLKKNEQESSERYFNIFTNILDIYIELDNGFRITSLSPSAVNVLGCNDEKELLLRSMMDFIVFGKMRALFLDAANGKTASSDREFLIRCDDGAERWLLSSCITRVSSERIVFVARDITERKKNVARQYEMAQLQRAILESSDDIIFHLSEQKISVSNRAAREFFVQRCNSSEPSSFNDLWTADELEQWEEFISQATEQGECSVDFYDTAGMRFFELRLKRLGDPGKVDISVFAKDVTEAREWTERTKRMNEELELRVLARTRDMTNAYNELESFCALVAHEFRAPVRAISLYNGILSEEIGTKASEDAKEALESIDGYCTQSLEMIKGLLDYSTVKARKIKLGHVNIAMLVNGVVRELRAINSERDIRLKISEDIPNIIGDEFLLNHAIKNILGNSVKYSSVRPYTQIEVTYSCDKDNHIISFTDNGVGFDMSGADKIFDVFGRMHTEEEFKGSGIGLAAVRSIVKSHGGSVRAVSAPDKGCTIMMYLPK